MFFEVAKGLAIPFLGTALGAACVFFIIGKMNIRLQNALNGFAAGVMIAASVWSLLIPAIDQCEYMGKFSFVPAVSGLLIGILFLRIIDFIMIKIKEEEPQRHESSGSKASMLMLAVTVHNLPEGMAVGVIYVGLLNGEPGITAAAAFTLALGIAIQNFPEGAIISMPMKAQGKSKTTSFLYGAMSGAIEPIGALFTIIAASFVIPVLPYLLGFAAGSMLYVVAVELIPEMHSDDKSKIGTWMFALGFCVMMALDVALG